MSNILYNEAEIREKIEQVASEINRYYNDKEGEVIAIAAMNGGIFFYVDLLRKLNFPVEMGVMSTSHYPNGLPGNDEVKIKYVDAQTIGKNVLLIDEICFTGKSLDTMKQILLAQGAKEVRSVVLVDQNKRDAIHRPDWSAIVYEGNKWIAGMGMDINGLDRNKPYIFFND